MSSLKDSILQLGGNSITPEDYDVLEKASRSISANNFVEIGARKGCSSMLFGSIAKETGGEVLSIEAYPTKEWQDNIKSMGLKKHVKLVNTFSPWVRDISKSIDFLFIDGDHRTICCIADYYYIAPWVRVGGLIAFHDTRHPECERMVNRAIDIILEEAKNLEEAYRSEGEMGTLIFRKTKEFA